MTFTPDTDLNFQARQFARAKISGAQANEIWDETLLQWFTNACTAGTTLVTNSGTAAAPNGSIATAIAAANFAANGNRNF